MTTITIERELLERALDALDAAKHSTLQSSLRQLRLAEISSEIRATLAAPATAPEPTTGEAVSRLSKALRDDLDYAWGWHCNVAMTAFDAGCPHDVANEGAARFMRLLAGVDTRKHPGFAGTQSNPKPSTDDRHAQELLAQDITITIERAKDELEFVRSILRGYPLSKARDDALRATAMILRALAAPATAPDELERLRKDAEQMLVTLTLIRNANPRNWEELSCEATEFERWVKSRANHSIIKYVGTTMKETP